MTYSAVERTPKPAKSSRLGCTMMLSVAACIAASGVFAQTAVRTVALSTRSNIGEATATPVMSNATLTVGSVTPTTDAPTWVLISGIVGNASGMHRVEQRLRARGYRVVVVDPYALSIDSTDVTFAALARRVDVVLGRMNIRDAHVVGHAHGAGVALRLAASYPARVSALDLLDAGAMPSTRTNVMGRTMSLIPMLSHVPGGKSWLRGKFADGVRENSASAVWFNAEIEKSYVAPVLADIGRSIALMQRLSEAQEPELVSAVIARVRVPVTVIIGAAPHAAAPTTAQVNALTALHGCLRVSSLQGVGHFPHEEAPDALLGILDTRCNSRSAVGVVK